MTANKRTFEVDRFLTRELQIRNPDNSCPSVNQVIFTDGAGGTYFGPLNPTIPTTGFNQITLTDRQEYFYANKPFNTLNIKEGPGIQILKQTINAQDYLTFQANVVIPSTFGKVTTGTGDVVPLTDSASLNIISYDGVNVRASSNILYVAGTPAFGIITLSTPTGNYSLYPSTSLSSVTVQAGFGINLTKTSNTSYTIASAASTFALNTVNVVGQGTLNFLSTYNQISLSTSGVSQIRLSNSTITINTNAFASVSFPGNNSLSSQNVSNTLAVSPGYGLTYSTLNNNSSIQIATSLPSSFSIISTPRGIITATDPENTLTIDSGYGIDYTVSGKVLTIGLSTTFVSQISTETGSIQATSNSVANFRQGKSIIYSTSSDNMLYINSKDFNRVDLIKGGALTTSLFASLDQKTFQIVEGPGMTITANTTTNQITFASISSVITEAVQYAYSYVQSFSTAATALQDVSSFVNTKTLSAAPSTQAILGFVPVFPIKIDTDSYFNRLYIGLDQSTLLFSTNTQISSVFNTFSSYSINSSTLTITTSSIRTSTLTAALISSAAINTGSQNVSSLSVGGSLVITSAPTAPSLLIASQISTPYLEAQLTRLSTIGDRQISTPLVVFNYISSQVGIGLATAQPQAMLHVGGTILAQNYATYSDSSLKNFKNQFKIGAEELEILKPWNFTWKDNELDDVGFAAEDVEKVLPSAVKRGANGLRMVDYGRLSIVSLAALRETNNRLNSIESTLCNLQNSLKNKL